MKRKKRVRVHLVSDSGDLPTVEGIMVSKRRDEYLVAVPTLLFAAGAAPAELEARWVAVPRERVAFYEVLT